MQGLEYWGTPSSPEAHARWHSKYEAVLVLALSHDHFVAHEMPDAKFAVFPECATVENGETILGHSATRSRTKAPFGFAARCTVMVASASWNSPPPMGA